MSIGDLFYYRYNIPGRRSKPDPPFLPSLFSSSSFFLFLFPLSKGGGI